MPKLSPLLLLSILFALSIPACVQTPPVRPPIQPSETSLPDPTVPQPSQTGTAPAAIRETPAPAADPTASQRPRPQNARTGYWLAAILDYAAGRLAVEMEIDFYNDTGDELDTLTLVFEPARLAPDLEIELLQWRPGGTPAQVQRLRDGILQLALEETLPPKERVTLHMGYSFTLPTQPGKLSLANGQVNLGDWYPFLPAYHPSNGWLAYRPNPVGETTVYDIADFDVKLDLENAPEGIVIAAPAAGQVDGNHHYFSGRGYRNFAFSLRPDFEVLQKEVAGVDLRAYYLPETAEAGEAVFAASASALEVFQQAFAPYPHETFSLVAGNFPDGLEFDGLAFLSQDYFGWYQGSSQEYLPLLAAHEVAHQWWLGSVGSDQAMEPWLDEALSIYSELVWLEEIYPELPDWWWEFRIAFYEPLEGNVNDTVYQYGSFRPYVNAVYLRGAMMMRDLRSEMGDLAFFLALREYAGRYQGREARGADFIAVMEEFHGEDLDGIWRNYFRP